MFRKTYSNLLIFCTSCKIPTVRAEADATNIQVPFLVNRFVLESGNQLTTRHVENLCGVVATSGNIIAIRAESHATNNTVVVEMVNQVDIEDTRNIGVEHGEPIRPFLFLAWRKLI